MATKSHFCSRMTVSETISHSNVLVPTLSLRLGLFFARPGVFPPSVFLDASRFQHVPFEFCSSMYALRNMPLILDRSYIFDRRPSVNEAFAILNGLALFGRNRPNLIGSLRFPDSYISVVRGRQHEIGGRGVIDVEDAEISMRNGPNSPLHPLRVINVARFSCISIPKTDSPIVRTRDETLARRTCKSALS